jgi:hypothetical protein
VRDVAIGEETLRHEVPSVTLRGEGSIEEVRTERVNDARDACFAD